MIRKRCKHAAGLSGAAKRKAWRACGCAWGVDLYVGGVRRWHNLGTDEHAARVQELRLRIALAEGKPTRGANGSGVRDQAEDWLAAREAEGAREQSLSTWRSRVKHLAAFFGDTPVESLNLSLVRRMVGGLRQLGMAPATVNGILAALGSVLQHARAHNGLDAPRLDMRGVRLRTHARTDHLTIEECQRVIAEAPEPWASVLEVALLTGLRKGELLALTVGDVERDRPVLHVRGTLLGSGAIGEPKTGSSRRAVTLSPRAHEILLHRTTDLHRDDEYALRSEYGRRLWPYRLQDADKALRAILDSLGLHRPGRGWHSFRHAHTALLNEAGVSLRDAAARLGHGATTAQTMAYGWAAEHGDASLIDEAVTRHSGVP